MSKPGRQARVKNNKHLHLRRESPRSSRMFLRRPACTRRPPRSRISLIIAKAISTRRLRRHRTAGRLSVLDTPKAFAATTRAHLIHVRCQYAVRFTDAFSIYISRALRTSGQSRSLAQVSPCHRTIRRVVARRQLHFRLEIAPFLKLDFCQGLAFPVFRRNILTF